jgi:hypothetical protein
VGARVKQLLARTLQEVADGLLGNAILEVSIYTTKGKLLARIMTCPLEGVVVELPIVAVVVEDFHSVFGRVLLKGKLGSNCHCQWIVMLKVDKEEATVVVNKDGDALIALLGKFAF